MAATTTGYGVADGSVEGYATKTLITPDGSLAATFAPGAGMVGCSLTHRGEELLGLRTGVARYAASGSTMGIPLLHPWANRLSGFRYQVAGRTVTLDPKSPLLHFDAAGAPMHGFQPATLHWQLTRTAATHAEARLQAQLDCSADAQLLALFPFPHQLLVDIGLRDGSLTIATTLRPTGTEAVPVSFGYHPYLRLPGVARADWHVEIPVRRQLIVDDRLIPTGASAPVEIQPGRLGRRAFDTPYTDIDSSRPFVLAGGGRRLEVAFTAGYPYTQVYAPADADFICFEPMTAPANALVTGGPALPLIAPSQQFTAVFTITIG